MNKRTGWENEATTRAINAQPWEPPPGIVKPPMSRLPMHQRFAAPVHRALEPRCVDCAEKLPRGEGAAVDQAELIAELAASNPHLRQGGGC